MIQSSGEGSMDSRGKGSVQDGFLLCMCGRNGHPHYRISELQTHYHYFKSTPPPQRSYTWSIDNEAKVNNEGKGKRQTAWTESQTDHRDVCDTNIMPRLPILSGRHSSSLWYMFQVGSWTRWIMLEILVENVSLFVRGGILLYNSERDVVWG